MAARARRDGGWPDQDCPVLRQALRSTQRQRLSAFGLYEVLRHPCPVKDASNEAGEKNSALAGFFETSDARQTCANHQTESPDSIRRDLSRLWTRETTQQPHEVEKCDFGCDARTSCRRRTTAARFSELSSSSFHDFSCSAEGYDQEASRRQAEKEKKEECLSGRRRQSFRWGSSRNSSHDAHFYSCARMDGLQQFSFSQSPRRVS